MIDSLEEMQYLTDFTDTNCEFIEEAFGDKQLNRLLEVLKQNWKKMI